MGSNCALQCCQGDIVTMVTDVRLLILKTSYGCGIDFTMYPYEERGYAPPRFQAPPPNNMTTSSRVTFDDDWSGEEESGDYTGTSYIVLQVYHLIVDYYCPYL